MLYVYGPALRYCRMYGEAYSPPCITARRGGCVIKQISRSHRSDAAGVVLRSSVGKPPRPRFQRTLRGIFLIARPPLLAVMQGGEYAFPYISQQPHAYPYTFRNN